MGEQRLTDLATLSVERELSGSLELDCVIDEFMNRDKNRKIILS